MARELGHGLGLDDEYTDLTRLMYGYTDRTGTALTQDATTRIRRKVDEYR